MKQLVIGTVPYLNARPLIEGLSERPDVQLIEATPSRLAVLLTQGDVEAAIVSAVVGLGDGNLSLLDAPAVVSDGPVMSIRLMSRVPISNIRTLALDESSRTGVMLCRVLLGRIYGLKPEIRNSPPVIEDMLATADAALIIGDPAMRAYASARDGRLGELALDLDLGRVWKERTGLPFVFAAWTAHPNADRTRLMDVLEQAALLGIQRLDEIAERESTRIGLPADLCRDYLHNNITYDFGSRARAGLQTFAQWAVEEGLLPPEAPDRALSRGNRR